MIIEATAISETKHLVYRELDAIVKKRSQLILERFGQVSISGIKNPKLLEVLVDVRKYWSRRSQLSRPILTTFSCEAVGGEPELTYDVGLMFTLASAGFGIHDDILDKSFHKHLGRSTILGLHGFDIALLVGDLLIFKAWTMFHEIIRKSLKPIRIADIIEAYGNSSIEICEAELMESLCRRNLEIDLDFYKNILWKAMAETEACTKIGAIMGDGQENEIKVLADFGRRIGFISRLGDDLEDCLNIKADLPHRIEFESIPLPLLYAAKSSTENYESIKNIIEKPHVSPLDVKTLLKLCFEAEAFNYVHKIAKKNRKEAIKNLLSLRPCKARSMLSLMIQKYFTRIDDLCLSAYS